MNDLLNHGRVLRVDMQWYRRRSNGEAAAEGRVVLSLPGPGERDEVKKFEGATWDECERQVKNFLRGLTAESTAPKAFGVQKKPEPEGAPS